MRRRPLNSSSRLAESGGEQGFWPSYADMMSAVALILFFLMLISYIQNLITGNDLQNTQEVLADAHFKSSRPSLSLTGSPTISKRSRTRMRVRPSDHEQTET